MIFIKIAADWENYIFIRACIMKQMNPLRRLCLRKCLTGLTGARLLVYRQKGDIRGAITSIKSALKLNNSNLSDHQILAELYSQLDQRPEEVIPEILVITETHPESPYTNFLMAILLETRDWKRSSQNYQQAIRKQA